MAIMNQHTVIISLLLSHPGLDLTVKDKQGLTPFAAAMRTKNNKAAQAILDREPTAAEQVLTTLSVINKMPKSLGVDITLDLYCLPYIRNLYFSLLLSSRKYRELK